MIDCRRAGRSCAALVWIADHRRGCSGTLT